MVVTSKVSGITGCCRSGDSERAGVRTDERQGNAYEKLFWNGNNTFDFVDCFLCERNSDEQGKHELCHGK